MPHRLLLATLAPLLLLGAVAVGTGAYFVRTISRDQALERQEVQARVAAAGLSGSLKGYMRLLQATAAELARYQGDDLRLQQELMDRANLLSSFSGGVGLLSSGGIVLAVTPPARAALGMNYAFRLYFQAVRGTGTPVLSSILSDPVSGESAVVVAVPFGEGFGRIGALVGQFSLRNNAWVGELNLLTPPTGGAVYLLDRAGNVIFHSDPAQIGRHRVTDEYVMRLAAEGIETGSLYRPPTGGDPLLLGLAPVADTGWYVVVEEPWANVAGEVARYQWAMTGLGGLVVVTVAALLVMATRRVVRPLGKLVSEGQRVLAGGRFRPQPEAGSADVRALLRVVNGMVAQLGEQQLALRRYALDVIRGQEEERLRLSRDLHDETVQGLVAINQRLDLLGRKLGPEPATGVEEIQSMVRSSIAEVRRLSNHLRPHVLEDLGLAAALQAITSDLEAQLPQVQAHCEVVGHRSSLPSELELTVFRIAQEALTNVRKHAKSATRVSVALIYEPEAVELLVEDNGPGFDRATPSAAEEGHLGLAGMEERAQLFGGSLTVESVPGQGTSVMLHLPL